VCPGEFMLPKFNLNSFDSVFIKEVNKNLVFGFTSQNLTGNQKITKITLIQFNLTFNQVTLGSKIENRFLIILKNKS
jgi:hypothetical protein